MNNNIKFSIIAILLLANLSIMTYFLVRHNKHKEKRSSGISIRERNPGGNMKYMDKRLNLSPEQAATFDSLRKDFFQNSRKARQEMDIARKQLYDLASSGNYSDTLRERQAQVIAEKQKAIELVTFDHFKTLRQQLNKDQQQKFDTMIHKMLKSPHKKFRKTERRERKMD